MHDAYTYNITISAGWQNYPTWRKVLYESTTLSLCIIPCQIDKNMLSTHSKNVFKNKNCGKRLIISVYDVHASVTKVTRAYERHDPKFGKPASVRSVYTY